MGQHGAHLGPVGPMLSPINLAIRDAINGPCNDLLPISYQAIACTNAGISYTGLLETNISKNINIAAEECQKTFYGLNLLTHWGPDKMDAILQKTFQMHFVEWKCMRFA